MSKITDEDLNTKSNLITEKYNFELTGLKDPVDVRKPSRNFLKIESLFSKIFSRKIITGPGLKDGGDLEKDITISIKTNDPTIKITQTEGIKLNKTDLTENNSNKIFTAKGALNLKNWLVSNYTGLMNNIRETLDTKILSKLPHGGYGGTGQDLKNGIDFLKNNSIYGVNDEIVDANLSILLKNGIWYLGENVANMPSEIAKATNGVLLSAKDGRGYYVSQTFYWYNGGEVYTRVYDTGLRTYTKWAKAITSNNFDFSKIYQKEIKDNLLDLNNVTTPGFYVCHDTRTSVTNFPTQLENLTEIPFTLIVQSERAPGSNEYPLQILWAWDRQFVRFHGVHTWSKWEEITSFITGKSSNMSWKVFSNGDVEIIGNLITRTRYTLPVTLPRLNEGSYTVLAMHHGTSPSSGVISVSYISQTQVEFADQFSSPVGGRFYIYTKA